MLPIVALFSGACGDSGSPVSARDGGNSSSGGNSSTGGNSTPGGNSGSSASSAASSNGSSASSGSSSSGSSTDGGTSDGGNKSSTLAVNLGTAGNYAILAKSGISNVQTSAITGNVGISPAAATYITG